MTAALRHWDMAEIRIETSIGLRETRSLTRSLNTREHIIKAIIISRDAVLTSS
jgi:hypothetical protein